MKTKTAAEKRYMQKAASLGCIVCEDFLGIETPEVELHHVTHRSGLGRKGKHTETIPLCFNHHRGGGFGVAVEDGVGTWEKNFGTQEYYLQLTWKKLGI